MSFDNTNKCKYVTVKPKEIHDNLNCFEKLEYIIIKIVACLLLVVLNTALTQAQNVIIVINGTVKCTTNHKAIADANVMLQDVAGKHIYAYAITNGKGDFSISHKALADSLLILVTGLNIKPYRRIIKSETQKIEIFADFESINIREVTVKKHPIERHADTLVYIVGSFIDSTDRSIGDVLRKMPGINVSSAGIIKYNGTPINKFYIEGLDMLQGRYGIATNNIRAQDIGAVEIYENHQPISVLRNLQPTDKAALNLKLKENARNTWSSEAQLGGGYKPGMWNGEVTALFVARSCQTLNTYKSNNTGSDVDKELSSLYEITKNHSEQIGVIQPMQPIIDEKYYLVNGIHSISTNAITKVADNSEISANANYTYDEQESEGISKSVFFVPNQNSISIDEITRVTGTKRKGEANVTFRKNSPNLYLKETFGAKQLMNLQCGMLESSNNKGSQHLETPNHTLNNSLNGTFRVGNSHINVNSDIEYSNSDAMLKITPAQYSIFDEKSQIAYQTYHSQQLNSWSSLSYTHTINRWSLTAQAKLNTNLHNLITNLNNENGRSADTLKNDAQWQQYNFVIAPGIGYRIDNKIYVSLSIPTNSVAINLTNKGTNSEKKFNKTYITPTLVLQANLSYSLKLNASANFSGTTNNLHDLYNGYVMNSYRQISTKQGDIVQTQSQNYFTSIKYSNVVAALFGSVSANYWKTSHDQIQGTEFDGFLMSVKSHPIKNNTEGYSVETCISKRFYNTGLLIALTGQYANSSGQILRQSTISGYRNRITSVELGVNLKVTPNIGLDYIAQGYQARGSFDNQQLTPIYGLQQTAQAKLTVQKLGLIIATEHYYNSTNQYANGSLTFLNAQLSYSHKQVDYSLDATNILGIETFRSGYYSEANEYTYSYTLRPRALLLKIKFRLI